MQHKFIVTIDANASKSEAAAYIRDAVRSWGGSYRPDNPFFGLKNKATSVRPVKGWSGAHKPAKVSVRRLKDRSFTVYASGQVLVSGLLTVKQARKFLRSRHPHLAKFADYSKA
jgi:hypothetical protein